MKWNLHARPHSNVITRAQTQMLLNSHTHTHTHTNTHTHMHTHLHTHTHTYTHTHAHTHLHTHTHIYTHTYTHKHTHVHPQGKLEDMMSGNRGREDMGMARTAAARGTAARSTQRLDSTGFNAAAAASASAAPTGTHAKQNGQRQQSDVFTTSSNLDQVCMCV